MLPLCVLNNLYTETTNYKHPTRGPQTQRITLNTSIHYTLHIYTPVCFALFPIRGLCQFGSRTPSPRQNMFHKTEHVGHWEDLETWLSVVTVSLLPKAAETLKHQTQKLMEVMLMRS